MSRVLHLTNDQFEVLYDLLEDTINDIQSHLDEDLSDDVKLDDYEIYKVYQQLNRLEGKSWLVLYTLEWHFG